MRYHPGITEKRMNNKRFRKTEEKILKVFFEEDNYISLDRMAKKIGIARSTLYHHHRAIREIIPDYQRYIMRRYKRRIRRLLRDKNTKMQVLYTGLLIFILQHSDVFAILYKNGRRDIVSDMIGLLTPRIERKLNLPKNAADIISIYVSEVTELIWLWIGRSCPDQEINILLSEIKFLTDSARTRLRPLLNIE